MIQLIAFVLGLALVIKTLASALSTFVVPRATRSRLNRLVFVSLLRVFLLRLRFTRTYEERDAIMAYYAPIGLMLLLPTWYVLIGAGYAAMYWAMVGADWQQDVRLSGSSLLTLGFAASDNFPVTLVMFSEAVVGLIMVALLIAYLPTMYAAFSQREQAVNLLEVRAGNPPSAVEMLLRFNRIHGLERLSDYWTTWETWFAEVEESHTTLPALVFFRSPQPTRSWVTAAGAVLDAASLALALVKIPYAASAPLCIRAGYLALRRIADYYDIPYPADPSYPQVDISIRREEFDQAVQKLAAEGVPLVDDLDKAWRDFAGWRVNYDQTLLGVCALTMAPYAEWSSDRMIRRKLPPLFLRKKR